MFNSTHAAFGMDSAPAIQLAQVRFVVPMQWWVVREKRARPCLKRLRQTNPITQAKHQCIVSSMTTICVRDHLRVLIVW